MEEDEWEPSRAQEWDFRGCGLAGKALEMRAIVELYTGNLYVQFDEGEMETCPQIWVRRHLSTLPPLRPY